MLLLSGLTKEKREGERIQMNSFLVLRPFCPFAAASDTKAEPYLPVAWIQRYKQLPCCNTQNVWHLTAAYTGLGCEREAHSLPISAQLPPLLLLEPAASWFAFGILSLHSTKPQPHSPCRPQQWKEPHLSLC